MAGQSEWQLISKQGQTFLPKIVRRITQEQKATEQKQPMVFIYSLVIKQYLDLDDIT
jgi:hypothetical protein